MENAILFTLKQGLEIALKSLSAKSRDFSTHPFKIDLNKKWLPKRKTIQNFNTNGQEFRKIRNENPPTKEIGVTS